MGQRFSGKGISELSDKESKSYVWKDEVCGELIYQETDWRKKDKVEFLYNGKKIAVDVFLRVLDSLLVEYYCKIGDNEVEWTDEDFEDDIQENEEYYENVKKIYEKYIGNPTKTISEIEKAVYESYISYEDNAEAKNTISEVLDKTSINRITVFDDRIEIDCSCQWNLSGGLGIVISSESVQTGSREILY